MYDISQIGLYPQLGMTPNFGLGNFGLDYSGSYGSLNNYMNPMMGMNGSIFGPGAYLGMYPGMYDPTFMARQYQNLEQSQVVHAGNMHDLMLQNETRAHRSSDRALADKILVDGDIKQGIQSLYAKIMQADQKGVIEEYSRLVSYVTRTYRDELVAQSGEINIQTSARQIIEEAYSSIISAQTGQTRDLRSDLTTKCEGAFENGFMTGFRRGHNDMYADEVMNYIYGERIDERESKSTIKTIGNVTGRAASVVEKGAIGAVGAVGATGLALGAGKLLSYAMLPFWKTLGKVWKPALKVGVLPFWKTLGKAWKPALAIGAIAGIAADIYWQCTKD